MVSLKVGASHRDDVGEANSQFKFCQADHTMGGSIDLGKAFDELRSGLVGSRSILNHADDLACRGRSPASVFGHARRWRRRKGSRSQRTQPASA